MKISLTFILILISTVSLKAQSLDSYIADNVHTESYTDTDSINSVNLVKDFYSNQASLSRTYDYELLNKKRKYEKWGKDIQIFGYGITLCISFVGGAIAYDNHWSLGWYIPTATAILCGGFYGFTKWSQYFEKKAALIQLSPIYSYSINDTFSIQAMTVSDFYNPKDFRFGIGFTTNF